MNEKRGLLMFRFIWNNWWRRKERFILLLIGAAVISVGLTYLFGLSGSNKETIIGELEERWSSSYDIVVRPEGTRETTEEDGLLDPNYLSGIQGKITREQYETIQEIDHVDVAAPIAMIGYADYTVFLDEFEIEEPGLYRITTEEIVDDGIHTHTEVRHKYLSHGEWNEFVESEYESETGPDGFVYSKNTTSIIPGTDSMHHTMMADQALPFAAIDPIQEAKLVGLDEAILDIGESRYFSEEDEVIQTPWNISAEDAENTPEEELSYLTTMPVILSNTSNTDLAINYTLEKLDVPFDSSEAADIVQESIQTRGDSLEDLSGDKIETFRYDDQEIYGHMINSVAQMDYQTGEFLTSEELSIDRTVPTEGGIHEWNSSEINLGLYPSPLVYESVSSPFPERWEQGYQLEIFSKEDEFYDDMLDSFREQNLISTMNGDWGMPILNLKGIGFFDPSDLDLAIDPTHELPMETYRPATAERVLDQDLNPVNPPETIKPTYDSDSFLANPPAVLTTLDAAEAIYGDEFISAIRIKVSGVDTLTEESQELVEQIAAEIENETGLITDITLGSGIQPALVHVPAINDQEEIGWVQQLWMKLGSSITIYREASMGLTWLIASIVVVAVIYVWSTNLVSLLARRKEFAVLLSVGWRPSQLRKLLFTESALFGLLVAILSWTMLGWMAVNEQVSISLIHVLLVGLFGLLIYMLGAIVPAYMTGKIRPYEAMRTGEMKTSSSSILKTRGIFTMAVNHYLGRWKRSVLSIISIALPTCLLAILLFITFRLQGVMYTTWLGEYAALQVESAHYVAMVVALIIAIFTTAEIMWQNIAERQDEIALLKAVGWKNGHIRLLIWTEGLLSGILATVVGLAPVIAFMWYIYGGVPVEELKFILLTALIPITVGILGTVVPAERATRISPIQGMLGGASYKKESKWMKYILMTVFGGIVIAFGYTIVQFITHL